MRPHPHNRTVVIFSDHPNAPNAPRSKVDISKTGVTLLNNLLGAKNHGMPMDSAAIFFGEQVEEVYDMHG